MGFNSAFKGLMMFSPQVSVVICTLRSYVLLTQGQRQRQECTYFFFTVTNDQENAPVTAFLRNTKPLT